MVPINTCASDNALALINNKFRHLFADAIVPLDPLSRVDTAVPMSICFRGRRADWLGVRDLS